MFVEQQAGPFPAVECAAERMVSLPMFPELTHEQIDYVCEAVGDAR